MNGTLRVALVHHPVINRNGEEIASVIDEFDVFDGGRLALTYGIPTLYVVNPVPAQRDKAARIIAHAKSDARDAARGRMDALVWCASLEDAIADASRPEPPLLVATSAVAREPSVGFEDVRERLAGGSDVLLVIGKAWGLAPSVLRRCDAQLQPIDAGTGFNHLSVRAAMAILIDRIRGR
ncbi:MAG: RNA methyltransferase [Nannocystaceae bacterium]|nr:RNA methyltransferase [bacterium]